MLEWWEKLKALRRRRQIRAELDEEIRSHIGMKAAATGDELLALRCFGNVTLRLQECREAWGWPELEGWIRDLRYGIRSMLRQPGFAATVVVTLAIGISATTAVFSLINTILLHPLPYPGSTRLVSLHQVRTSADQIRSRVAPAQLEDWAARTHSFDALAGYDLETVAETTGPVPEQIHIAKVSPRFFEVLGTAPLVGKVFSDQEEHFGGPAAIVISERLWQRRFSGNVGVLGRNLHLEKRSYVVSGVMPEGFQFPDPTIDGWIAMQADPDLLRDRTAAARFYECVGRLSPGFTLRRAQQELEEVQRTLGNVYPTTDAGWSVAIEPLKEHLVGSVTPTLWLLFFSVGLLLLIAASNVACLLLSQINARAREISTRCALGAGRGAIVRLLLAQGLGFSTLGCLAGVLAAAATVKWLRLSDIPRISELAIDGKVLLFAAGMSVSVAMVSSLAPAVQVLRKNFSVVRCGRGVIGGSQRLPSFLVAGQLSLAMILLVSSGLLIQTLLHVRDSRLGFETEHVLAFRISASYSEAPEDVVQRHQRTLDMLRALPGVLSASISAGLPGNGPLPPVDFRIAGEPYDPTGAHSARRRIVTAQYFRTLRIPILGGETCRMNPDPKEEFQALVNKAFTDRYLRGRDPIGRTVTLHPQESTPSMRIVGLVDNAREEGYAKDVEPVIYTCGFLRWLPDSDFLVQTRANPATFAHTVREAVHTIEPARAVYSVQPLSDALSDTLSRERFRTKVLGGFSSIALILAAIGLYGVLAYMVAQRTREFGVRIALGATRAQIGAEIVRSAGPLVAAGLASGIVVAAVVAKLMGSLLVNTSPLDLAAYSSAAGVLSGAALLACVIPGLRATSISPTVALREQ